MSLGRRVALLGTAEHDTDESRAQKATLTLAASFIVALSVLWVGAYLALGLPRSAAIPFAYQAATIASIVLFARTKSYRLFRASQAAMMTTFPFLLQWSLGGFVASSAVSLWALCAAVGTLFFFTAGESIPIRDGELMLGTWQRVLFLELDRERDRRWLVQVVGNE